MQKVLGFGGVFFKANNPDALRAWYRDNLGLDIDKWGGCAFVAKEGDMTVWSVFPQDTNHFEPSHKPFSFNFRVADLHAMLAQLRAAGAQVDSKVDEYDYGKFGWVIDPEGNRIELWQPA